MNDKKRMTRYSTLAALLVIGIVLAIFTSPVFCILTQAVGLLLLVVSWSIRSGEDRAEAAPDPVEMADLRVPDNMPLPYAVVSGEGGVLRANPAFWALCGGENRDGAALEELLPGLEREQAEQVWRLGEKTYHVYQKTSFVTKDGRPTGNQVETLCFVDISDLGGLKQALVEERTAVGLVYIDNYDEAVATVDDSRVPLLTALIDKRLSDMMEQSGGICKKLEKDRYLCLVSTRSLSDFRQKRFEILADIRGIKVGEHIPVTLSVGFGLNPEGLLASQRDARSAVDLALGRGGDQAVVKENDKLYFYGGKSGEVAHNARVRARVKADAFLELLRESDVVFAMGHQRADFDSLGSALGVYRMAQMVGKPCYILMQTAASGLERLQAQMAADPEYKGIFLSTREALDKLTENSLTVVVDTHIPEMVDCPRLLEDCRRVVVLDHHRKSVSFIDKAVLVYHEPYASSTAELVSEMLQYQGERVHLKRLEADALLAGMTVDTRNFSGKTGAITFEIAAYLKRQGADGVRVRKLLQSDLVSCKLRARTLETAELYLGKVALALCPEAPEVTPVLAAKTADELLDVAGVSASFVLCRTDDTVYVSARSLGEPNVQVIMETLGGGGHQTVAGGQFPGKTLDEVKVMLQQAIEEHLKEEE